MTTEMERKLAFLKTCETGNIADAYVRLGMVNDMLAYTVDSARCRPLQFEDTFAGPAVTIRFTPLLPGAGGKGLFDVFTQADAGSVVVMTGVKDRCFMGDVLAQYAAHQGMGAIVAEGFVRDSKGCIRAGIPVFSQGGTTAAKGKTLYSVTAVNEPITFYGIQINPGDILVGDCDGVIRIPLEIFDRVYEEVLKVTEYEAEYEKVFKAGGPALLQNLKAVSTKSH